MGHRGLNVTGPMDKMITSQSNLTLWVGKQKKAPATTLPRGQQTGGGRKKEVRHPPANPSIPHVVFLRQIMQPLQTDVLVW